MELPQCRTAVSKQQYFAPVSVRLLPALVLRENRGHLERPPEEEPADSDPEHCHGDCGFGTWIASRGFPLPRSVVPAIPGPDGISSRPSGNKTATYVVR